MKTQPQSKLQKLWSNYHIVRDAYAKGSATLNQLARALASVDREIDSAPRLRRKFKGTWIAQ